jgi:hypothetical protein
VRQTVRHEHPVEAHASPPRIGCAHPLSCGEADDSGEADWHHHPRIRSVSVVRVGATCLPHPALRGSLRVGGRGGVRGGGSRRVVCRVPFWGFRGVLGARGGASRGDVGAGQCGKVRWKSGRETFPVGPVVPRGRRHCPRWPTRPVVGVRWSSRIAPCAGRSGHPRSPVRRSAGRRDDQRAAAPPGGAA